MKRQIKELPCMFFPNITESMYDKMCHAIGLSQKHNKGYYYPYRNYYDSAECDTPDWDKLVELNLAEKRDSGFYGVTLLGLCTMSIISGIKIYNPCATCDADLKRYLFKSLCERDVFCGYGCWFPTSVRALCNQNRLPIARTYKAMHELVADGLAIKSYEGGIDDDGNPHCIHGYYLTEKAKGTEVWKKAYEKEMDFINESLNERH